MLNWLLDRPPWIEQSLANRHLRGQTLILYDVSSSYFEGQECPLAKFGHNRDGKKGEKQITFGLLCAGDGCPVAVEVFAGNTSDPATVSAQVARIRERFHIERVALVGDRAWFSRKPTRWSRANPYHARVVRWRVRVAVRLVPVSRDGPHLPDCT